LVVRPSEFLGDKHAVALLSVSVRTSHSLETDVLPYVLAGAAVA